MCRTEGGWHTLDVPDAGCNTRYRFILPDGRRVPDPASRFQPEDVHGPSEVTDPAAYNWSDGDWGGRPWHHAVLYEMHIGAFTEEGSFRSAIAHLRHLATLGITAISLMPIADFSGRRNWGYDGVLLYAPDSTYGRPDDLKALVDAAHALGLMVLLDVVYNHFGPEGNFLPAYAPAFFNEERQTAWGPAMNFDGPANLPVREFIIQNALYWIEEFHVDGLRLDAAHAIVDDGPKHLLEELAERVHAAAGARQVHLVLENEQNQARLLVRGAGGEPRYYSAQWNDDVHHALHVAATGEDQGYYADYLDDGRKLGRALAEGFAFQGEMMEYRGRPRGEPSTGLPSSAFVAFIQNHDQIGNRALGERIDALAAPEAVRAIGAVYLLLPQIPMLFMGEEWGATQPFPFFCDFDGALGEAVREGRRREFARFPAFSDDSMRARIPDPLAASTFVAAKLDWNDLALEPHARRLDWYRRILRVRHDAIVPLIPAVLVGGARYHVVGNGAVWICWPLQGGRLTLAANLSGTQVQGFPEPSGRVLWLEGDRSTAGTLNPWAVSWTVSGREA